MKKRRIDELLVERGLAKDVDEARRFVMLGVAVANDKRVDKAGDVVNADAVIRLKNQQEFVSRGGYKLKAAIENFGLDFAKKIVIDIGSSTGGFTDVALKYGAEKVYAIDVGSNIIHNKLLSDSRVILLEDTNFRTLQFEKIGELADIIVADLSFISLTAVMENVTKFIKPDGYFIPLIKPQFEAKREDVGVGGIVTDENVRKAAIDKIIQSAHEHGFKNEGVIKSPITGAKGNVEYLIKLKYFIGRI